MKVGQNVMLLNGTNGIFGGSLIGNAQGKEQGSGLFNFANTNFGVGGELDPIEQKKEAAKKQAMKIVSDAFDRESAADNAMDKMRDRQKELISERNAYKNELAKAEASGMGEDELKTMTEEYGKMIRDAEDEARAMDMSLRSTKIERTKHNTMADAYKEADGVMEAARDDIINMINKDAMEHIEEVSEEAEEKAEKLKESREELEERIEKHNENAEASLKLADEIRQENDALAESVDNMSEANERIKNMLERLALTDEDIKGIEVDKEA